MVDTATARRPAVATTPWMRPLAAMSRLNFRGGAEAQHAAGGAFGATFSTAACRAVRAGERAALWLGPDEQLLLAPAGDAAALQVGLAKALSGIPHSLVDVSHRHGALELRGPHAAWLLNGLCPLDLAPRAFPIDMCTRTVFAKAEIVLWRKATAVFHLETGRSFTDYVVGLLQEIARELPE